VRFDSGLLGHNGDVSNYPPIDEWTETLHILEANGYGGVWAAEHHFFWDGWTNPVPTNPVLFNTFAAGQTQSINQTKAPWDAYRGARPNELAADAPERLAAMRPTRRAREF
jgi:alkanesulfonate monooxygenase SsuD/methylene tetrahydromethanopterin reductase-like flavin-dependent oxidoreductase (luciferase family)